MESPFTPEQLEALRSLGTCTVANAIETFNVRLRNEGFADGRLVRCMFEELPPMLGYAVTARIRSSAPPIASSFSLLSPQKLTFADRDDWWQYVLSIPPPRVVVMQDVDPSPGLGAFLGDVHASICQGLGCVGYVTNGAVRDLEAVRRSGFHFFAGHVSVSHAYAHIIDFGEAVDIGGMRVRPGDMVHGDRCGVQTIPLKIAAEIPAVAACLEEKERKIIEYCHSPEFTLKGLRVFVKEIEKVMPCEAAIVNKEKNIGDHDRL